MRLRRIRMLLPLSGWAIFEKDECALLPRFYRDAATCIQARLGRRQHVADPLRRVSRLASWVVPSYNTGVRLDKEPAHG